MHACIYTWTIYYMQTELPKRGLSVTLSIQSRTWVLPMTSCVQVCFNYQFI
uniref:Predicted protein n=1 Tax=Hordeum vulgare subsp. vulgare TaxID=112509 RepID=F2DYE7_HORVV|nr:predicted protein [Hordeum vulgare subsp. vulgare]